jgi:hypothetical protein
VPSNLEKNFKVSKGQSKLCTKQKPSLKFITENNISSFMVQPVAIYNGQTLTAATKRLSDLSDPFFTTLREDGTEIVLYKLYKHDPSSTSYNKYLVRYATYNGI